MLSCHVQVCKFHSSDEAGDTHTHTLLLWGYSCCQRSSAGTLSLSRIRNKSKVFYFVFPLYHRKSHRHVFENEDHNVRMKYLNPQRIFTWTRGRSSSLSPTVVALSLYQRRSQASVDWNPLIWFDRSTIGISQSWWNDTENNHLVVRLNRGHEGPSRDWFIDSSNRLIWP